MFPKTSTNAINVVTLISMLGLAVGTTAMILVLSVFNGLTGLIEDMFSAMDSDLRIEASKGMLIPDSDSVRLLIAQHSNVQYVGKTIEGKAGLKYKDRQAQATIKGVDSLFAKINPITSTKKINKTDSIRFIYAGEFDLSVRDGIPNVVMGGGVANVLKANIHDVVNPVHVYVKARGPLKIGSQMPAFKNEILFPVANFAIQKEYDDSYVLMDLEAARSLFEYGEQITAYELGLKDPKKAEATQKDLQKTLGNTYKVLTLPDRHQTLYKVMRNEKYVSYFILLLLVAITAVNIIGSLSMIVLEKSKDIAVMKTMGFSDQLILRIFLYDGLLLGAVSVGVGLVLGAVLGFLQLEFGLLKLTQTDSYQLDTYPVRLVLTDFVVVGLSVLVLSVLAAWYPARKASLITVVEGLRR